MKIAMRSCYCLVSVFVLMLVTALPCPAEDIDNPASILDTPARFHGPEGTDFDVADATSIPIGFFGPVGHPAWNGATLALEEANRAGGYQDKPFRLVTRWDPDPWKGGSREAVRLILEDNVLAAIGGIDGDSTHVIEQVTTKIPFPLISPVSGDPSLTLTAVPWMFRLPPSTDAMADAVVQSLADAAGEGDLKIASVYSTNRDGRAWRDALEKSLAKRQLAVYLETVLDDASTIGSTVDLLRGAEPDCVILCARLDLTRMWLDAWNPGGVSKIPVAYRESATEWRVEKAMYKGWQRWQFLGIDVGTPEFEAFRKAYEERFPGKKCDGAAANGYDAANLILRAIHEAGPNRTRIRDAIAATETRGVGGLIRWDNGGGNTRPVHQEINMYY